MDSTGNRQLWRLLQNSSSTFKPESKEIFYPERKKIVK